MSTALDHQGFQQWLLNTVTISSRLVASAEFERIELQWNSDFTEKQAADVVRTAAVLRSSKQWNDLVAVKTELKAKLVPIVDQNPELAKPFARPVSDKLRASRERIINLLQEAAKSAI